MKEESIYAAPKSRSLFVLLDRFFCYSEPKEGSYVGGPEDVGYDNWLDGLE